jgi:hypothetical protein
MLACKAENQRCLPIAIALGAAVRPLATSFPYATDCEHRFYGDPTAFEAQVPR